MICQTGHGLKRTAASSLESCHILSNLRMAIIQNHIFPQRSLQLTKKDNNESKKIV